MSIVDELIKALQATIAPQLNALTERVDANHREMILRFDAINARFDDLIDRLALHRRIEDLEREQDEKRRPGVS